MTNTYITYFNNDGEALLFESSLPLEKIQQTSYQRLIRQVIIELTQMVQIQLKGTYKVAYER